MRNNIIDIEKKLVKTIYRITSTKNINRKISFSKISINTIYEDGRKRDYKIGDVVSRKIMVDNDGHSEWSQKAYPGKVIYIHPENRFIVLEFNLPGGTTKSAYNIPLTKQINRRIL